MSIIKQKFYNHFWQSKSCQNLFLLSKEELLETVSYGKGKKKFVCTSNRLIISNAQEDNETFDTIKFRNEDYDIVLGGSLEDKIEYFLPIIQEFLAKRFKNSLSLIVEDFKNNGFRFIFKSFLRFIDEENREEHIIDFLQEYQLIGRHINNLSDLSNHLEKNFLQPKKVDDLINEQTIDRFSEGVKFLKELYVNQSYKRLHATNQVLVNTLNKEDNFQSRLTLFHHLYESKIISHSNEDAFIECSHCQPGTYRGVFQLKLDPNKLKNLKCPVCSNDLTYFVPYKLHEDIYEIVKDKDGLLQNALVNKLGKDRVNYELNKMFLNDIEIDCIVKTKDFIYVLEVKMYKINTAKNKLKNKIKKHFGKLVSDVVRLSELKEFQSHPIKPILLVNVLDEEFIKEIEAEIKLDNKNAFYKETTITTLNLLKY